MNSKFQKPFKRKFVYYEKQGNDNLCAVHCLNALFQGPFFDVITLSEIGQQLDKLEKDIFSGKSRYGNVAEDGNFNVQVLEAALKERGCTITPIKSSKIAELESKFKVEGFIFNSSVHWFTLRKIDGIWFNLNSLSGSKLGPEIVSDFYLSAFMEGAEQEKYTIFFVNNLPNLPDFNSEIYSNLADYQKLIKYEDIVNYKANERAKKEEEDKKFKAFCGKGYTIEQNQHADYEDEESQRIMEESLFEFIQNTAKELPPEPEKGGVSITIKYNTEIFRRRWNYKDTIRDLKKFCQVNIPTSSHVEIFQPFPRTVYNLDQMTIEEAGFKENDSAFVKII